VQLRYWVRKDFVYQGPILQVLYWFQMDQWFHYCPHQRWGKFIVGVRNAMPRFFISIQLVFF
jgi:hypothetical protein